MVVRKQARGWAGEKAPVFERALASAPKTAAHPPAALN